MQLIGDHSSYPSKRDYIRSCRTLTHSVLSGVWTPWRGLCNSWGSTEGSGSRTCCYDPCGRYRLIWGCRGNEWIQVCSLQSTRPPHAATAHWNKAHLKRAVLSGCQELPRRRQCKESACQCRRPRHRFSSWVRRIPLEQEMATRCSILAWEMPWTEEPAGLQSRGSQRVRHDWGAQHTRSVSVSHTPDLKEFVPE